MPRSYQAPGMASVLCSQCVGTTQDRIYLFVLIHSEVISSFLACSTSYISRSWFASPSHKVCGWSYRTRIRRAKYAFPRTGYIGSPVSGNEPSRNCSKSLGRPYNVALQDTEMVLFGLI